VLFDDDDTFWTERGRRKMDRQNTPREEMNDDSSDISQDDQEQLPSWEELANVQFSIPFDPKDYAKPFFYGGLGLFAVGLAAGTLVSGVAKPPQETTASSATTSANSTEQQKIQAMMAARAEGFRLVSTREQPHVYIEIADVCVSRLRELYCMALVYVVCLQS